MSNFDFNTLPDGIVSYATLVGTSNSPIGAYANNWGVVITWRNTGVYALQICWNQTSTPSFHIRFGDGLAQSIQWKNWVRFLLS